MHKMRWNATANSLGERALSLSSSERADKR